MSKQAEYTLWGRKPLAETWQEEIITHTADLAHLAGAKKWAQDNGFIGLRIVTDDGNPVDIAKMFKASVAV